MISNIKIGDVMTHKLVTLHPKDKLQRAKDIFKEIKIHHIPIVVMNRVVGIVSQGDILYLENVIDNSFDRFVLDKKFQLDTVDQVMTSNPICADVDKPLKDVINIMLDKGINAVPITEDGELKGIVTSRDLMKLLITHLD